MRFYHATIEGSNSGKLETTVNIFSARVAEKNVSELFNDAMGNKQFTSAYTVSAELLEEVRQERWMRLIDSPNVAQLNLSDYGNLVTSNPFRHVYTVMLNPNVDPSCQLIMLFPQHPIPKKRILFTNHYTSLYKMGIEINERIRASAQITFQILCGDRVFHFTNAGGGTCYLVWCTRVNQSNRNEQRNVVAKMIPAMVQLDGHGRGRNIVLMDPAMKQVRPLPLKDTTVITPFRVVIFACETLPPENTLALDGDRQQRPIRTYSENDALSRTTECTLDSTFVMPALQANVPETESDGEIIEEGDELEFVPHTPRILQ